MLSPNRYGQPVLADYMSAKLSIRFQCLKPVLREVPFRPGAFALTLAR
jgi:hypothetical protein